MIKLLFVHNYCTIILYVFPCNLLVIATVHWKEINSTQHNVCAGVALTPNDTCVTKSLPVDNPTVWTVSVVGKIQVYGFHVYL